MKLLLLLAINLSTILPTLKQIESGNNVNAIGDSGKAYGVLQIHKICVDDVNRLYKTTYTHQDMFNEACAEEVFYLYIGAGIRRYQLRYGEEPSEKQIVRMWNGGIYKGYKKSTTLPYANKYFKQKLLSNQKF